MKHFFTILPILFLIVPLGGVAGGEGSGSTIETQVLQVFATTNSGYYHKPWKTPDFSNVKASGFFFRDEKIFPGREGLILTNAHAVSQAQSIRVSNGREKRQYNVKPVGICNSADFAVLQMEPGELKAYENRNGKIVPLELGDSDMLRVGDKVVGWGYPLGGEMLSKSEQGEISRIEVTKYAYSEDRWLVVQASLQQNQGNSGGPVLKDGKVVGVAFQGLKTTDRINYFIPVSVVKGLMPLLNNQSLIPLWRYQVQHMFPRLRDYFDLGPDRGGVLLDYVIPGGGPYTFGLRANDILLEIDDHGIDNYGQIFFKPLDQKVDFQEVLNRKKVGDPLTVKVLRDGQVRTISGGVTAGLPKLVPRIFTPANYFIYSGVGFIELTLNCIDNLGKSGEPLRAKYVDKFPQRPYEKIVIISEIFPEYGLVETAPYLQRVCKIDGQEVLNIEHLYKTIQNLASKGKKKVLLEVSEHLQLPLDLERASELDAQIREKYGILYMRSPEGFRK